MKNYCFFKRLSMAAVVIVSSFCMYGCSIEEIQQPDNLNPYLHIDIPENNAFSESQLEILALAYRRIERFVIIENDEVILNTSAKEVNISEELFSFIQEGIDQQNRQRKLGPATGALKVTDPNKSMKADGGPPTEGGGGGGGVEEREEITFIAGLGYYQTTATLSHDQAIELFHFMQDVGSYTGLVSLLTGWYKPVTFQAFILGSYGWLTTAHWNDLERGYLNSGRNNGIQLVETTFTGSFIPLTTHTQSYR